MRDFNIVIKNKQKIEKLGWIITPNDNGDWILMTFTPNCRTDYLKLPNRYFLNELYYIIDNYTINGYIDDAIDGLKKKYNYLKPNYEVLLNDAKWFKEQLDMLYNTLKDANGFDEIEDDEDDEDEESEDEPDARGKAKKEDN